MKSLRCMVGSHLPKPTNATRGSRGGMTCARCQKQLSGPNGYTTDTVHDYRQASDLPICERCGRHAIVRGVAISLGTVEGEHIINLCDPCGEQMSGAG